MSVCVCVCVSASESVLVCVCARVRVCPTVPFLVSTNNKFPYLLLLDSSLGAEHRQLCQGLYQQPQAIGPKGGKVARGEGARQPTEDAGETVYLLVVQIRAER